jgi:hypothetical protein
VELISGQMALMMSHLLYKGRCPRLLMNSEEKTYSDILILENGGDTKWKGNVMILRAPKPTYIVR